MLGKMIKHEFRATGRLYVPIMAIIAIMTPVLGLILRAASAMGKRSIVGNIIGGISTVGYIIALVGFFIASTLFVVMRFYRTVATSESYLTFCLPVSQNHILLSKLIVGTIWQLASIIVAVLSLYCMLLIQGRLHPGQIIGWLHDHINVFPFLDGQMHNMVLLLIEMAVIIFVSMVSSTLMFYLSICLGQLFNEHRVVASIVMYVAVYTAAQIITLIVFLPFVFASGSVKIGEVSVINNNLTDFGNMNPMLILALTGVINAVFGVVCYIISSVILKKKTNIR